MRFFNKIDKDGQMNIALIGRTEALYNTANYLMKNGHCIKLIVTDKEALEYSKTAEDFKFLSRKIGSRYICTSRINFKKHSIGKLGKIDIGISLNYTRAISQSIIDMFPLGILNAHAGDLPMYRGNACPNWAIINGEKKIGLCIHKMVGKGIDSGDIVAREYFKSSIKTKIGYVYDWLIDRIPILFLKSINKLRSNPAYFLEKQSNDPRRILRCYPRVPEDSKICWAKSNVEIVRLINASSKPFSGAYCFHKGRKIIIWDAELCDDKERYCAIPGQVSCIDGENGSVVVITGKGKIRIKEIGCDNSLCLPEKIIKSIRIRLE